MASHERQKKISCVIQRGSQVGQAVPDEMGERDLLIRFYDLLMCCATTKTFKHFPRTQCQAQPDLRHLIKQVP